VIKNLKPQLSYILLPNIGNKPFFQRKAVAFFSIKVSDNAKRLFLELDESLRKIVFSEKDLDTYQEFFNSLYSEFIALYQKENKQYVYYSLNGVVDKFLLNDKYFPPINTMVLIKRSL
jgi:hypothetical protein